MVQKRIQEAEAENQSWILSGFPRTKVQALSLQKMAVLPDQFIKLDIEKHMSLASIKTKCFDQNSALFAAEVEQLSQQIYSEYELNMRQVEELFSQFIYHFDVTPFMPSHVEAALKIQKMLNIRFRSKAPRRPPRIILLGPPGAGRSTQSEILSRKFGLINVSPALLIKQECAKHPAIKTQVKKALEAGEPVPDDLILRLVENRLKQSDCRMSGWVLDGFPESEAQVNLLNSMRIKPSLVCIFEQSVDESVRRLSNRKVDPVTGELFNTEVNPPKAETQTMRL